MMKSNNGSTPANNTDEILLNKTPQQQPQTIPRVTHSPLAAPCGQGWDGAGVVEVSFNTTLDERPVTGHLIDVGSTDTAASTAIINGLSLA